MSDVALWGSLSLSLSEHTLCHLQLFAGSKDFVGLVLFGTPGMSHFWSFSECGVDCREPLQLSVWDFILAVWGRLQRAPAIISVGLHISSVG